MANKDISAATYAALRTRLGLGESAGLFKAGQEMFVSGRAANNDGGEGKFQIVPIGSLVDNGGTILTGGSFAAVRVYKGPISATWFGVSVENTDAENRAALQAAFNVFGVTRGEVFLPIGAVPCAGGLLDFKRASLTGQGPLVSELLVGTDGGLMTSIEDQQAPFLQRFSIRSSSENATNGQILLDWTGVNYPRANDLTLFGGEIGMKIARGIAVECHYGLFQNIYFQKNTTGLEIHDGQFAQTHTVLGGRFWDCSVGYRNKASGGGASDINFLGTAFESAVAVEHETGATDAETKWFACRNESSAADTVLTPVGTFFQLGTYWSGNRRPITLDATSGKLVERANVIKLVGVNNSVDQVARNLLPNATFEFDRSVARTAAGVIPGWTQFGSTHFDSGKASGENYLRLERQAASGSTGIDSHPFSMLAGKYVLSAGWIKENFAGQGSVRIDMLIAGSTAGAGGTYFTQTFPMIHSNSRLPVQIDCLQDIEQVQFRVSVDAATTGRYFYIFSPVLYPGRHAALADQVPTPPRRVTYGVAAPTAGYWSVGDICWNTSPTAGGAPGWLCTTAGTSGTWKAMANLAA